MIESNSPNYQHHTKQKATKSVSLTEETVSRKANKEKCFVTDRMLTVSSRNIHYRCGIMKREILHTVEILLRLFPL